MKYDLSSNTWTLKGFYPYVPLQGKSMETGRELKGITQLLPATVPGGVHYDLYRAGLIPYPYRDMDSFACEWVEHRWWMYRTMIQPPQEQATRFVLVFEGLDYHASLYVDGQLVCRHEGMYDPVHIDITDAIASARARDGEVALSVLFRHVPDEIGQIGRTSETFTQKSRFNYKWDFGTRLVNIGIWGPCYLLALQEASLEDPFVDTTVQSGTGIVRFSATVARHAGAADGLRLCCTLSGHGTDQRAEATIAEDAVQAELRVEAPALWYPNGYGGQPLYDFTATLCDASGNTLDTWTKRVGIRSLAYRQNEGAPEDSLPYTFVLNDTPIYCRGANMTPLDHIYGNLSPAHYAYMVRLMREMNVNMVRIWGGGIIEQEAFYDLCDAHGILVWQEFIQSSSGIDNVPSKKEGFLKLLETAATSAVKARRSHVSLTVWSGGNELMDADMRPATYADSNIAMLKEIVARLDPGRLFLPTSASGPSEFVSETPGISHDVHGDWLYRGNPGHYALYSASDSLFHSEFGTDGMASYEVLPWFMSPQLCTLEPAVKNMAYRHHGEWWCTFGRDEIIFGSRKSLREMSWGSQWMQAEGLRFILEANRRRAPANSGSLIWQMNEPWPNVSCTCLVDYYLNPKMAWYWCRDAFEAFHVSMQYAKLDYRPGERLAASVHASHNEGIRGPVQVTMEAYAMDGQLIAQTSLSADVQTVHSAAIGDISLVLPEDLQGLFLVRLSARYGEEESRNTYFFGCTAEGEPVYGAALQLAPAQLEQRILSERPGMRTLQITNRSQVAALHVRPLQDPQYLLLADTSAFTLLPGETETVTVTYQPRFASGFLPVAAEPLLAPRITFECMNAPAK